MSPQCYISSKEVENPNGGILYQHPNNHCGQYIDHNGNKVGMFLTAGGAVIN